MTGAWINLSACQPFIGWITPMELNTLCSAILMRNLNSIALFWHPTSSTHGQSCSIICDPFNTLVLIRKAWSQEVPPQMANQYWNREFSWSCLYINFDHLMSCLRHCQLDVNFDILLGTFCVTQDMQALRFGTMDSKINHKVNYSGIKTGFLGHNFGQRSKGMIPCTPKESIWDNDP